MIRVRPIRSTKYVRTQKIATSSENGCDGSTSTLFLPRIHPLYSLEGKKQKKCSKVNRNFSTAHQITTSVPYLSSSASQLSYDVGIIPVTKSASSSKVSAGLVFGACGISRCNSQRKLSVNNTDAG